MNKEQLLSEIQSGLDRGEISQSDLARFHARVDDTSSSAESRHVRLSTVLYYIGGAIIVFGIATLVGTRWQELSSFMRFLVTAGVCILTYIVGAVASKDERISSLSMPFFLVSNLLLPVSTYVILDTLNISMGSHLLLAAIAAIYAVWGWISYKIFNKQIFTFFTLLFGTAAMYLFIGYIVEKTLVYSNFNIWLYAAMAIGISHIVIGRTLKTTSEKVFTSLLYTVGLFEVLGSGLSLGGVWDVLYALLVVAVLYVSAYFKSRIFLWIGAFFLMCYLIKITSKYFSNSLGWPLALVLIGLALIGVGYGTVYLNKRYMKGEGMV